MKKFIALIVIVLSCVSVISAQKLIIGERAPELKIKEWIGQRPAVDNKVRLIEFFYSTSAPSRGRLSALDKIADKYAAKLSVIVVSKEARDKVVEVVIPDSRKFFTALDDNGRSFTAYEVQFVPFSVMVDARGRVLWMGNSASLTDEVITKNL